VYGLLEGSIITNERLVKHLDEYGYPLTACTPGLVTHATRPITLPLVVDGFGAKYVSRARVTLHHHH
jgi:hypothetical protein